MRGIVMSTNEVSLTAEKKKTIGLKIVTYIVSVLLALMVLLPFISMIREIFGDEVVILPTASGNFTVVTKPRETMMTWKEFTQLFNKPTWTAFGNLVLVTVTSTILNIYFSAITAYAITAYEWKLREAFEKFIIVTMMIPGTVASIGFVQMCYKFHLANNLVMLIIPAIATPMTVFFMRMYLKATFSKEVVESARIDGAGEFRIFNQIMLPLMKPAIATQTIFCFVASWSNSWVPSIILIDDKVKTLNVLNYTSATYVRGAELLMCIPPVLVYLFLSKHIVEGVALGSVKA
jgi:multiple sugar transport system permease protein